jgi:hypothetical protein
MRRRWRSHAKASRRRPTAVWRNPARARINPPGEGEWPAAACASRRSDMQVAPRRSRRPALLPSVELSLRPLQRVVAPHPRSRGYDGGSGSGMVAVLLSQFLLGRRAPVPALTPPNPALPTASSLALNQSSSLRGLVSPSELAWAWSLRWRSRRRPGHSARATRPDDSSCVRSGECSLHGRAAL